MHSDDVRPDDELLLGAGQREQRAHRRADGQAQRATEIRVPESRDLRVARAERFELVAF